MGETEKWERENRDMREIDREKERDMGDRK